METKTKLGIAGSILVTGLAVAGYLLYITSSEKEAQKKLSEQNTLRIAKEQKKETLKPAKEQKKETLKLAEEKLTPLDQRITEFGEVPNSPLLAVEKKQAFDKAVDSFRAVAGTVDNEFLGTKGELLLDKTREYLSESEKFVKGSPEAKNLDSKHFDALKSLQGIVLESDTIYLEAGERLRNTQEQSLFFVFTKLAGDRKSEEEKKAERAKDLIDYSNKLFDKWNKSFGFDREALALAQFYAEKSAKLDPSNAQLYRKTSEKRFIEGSKEVNINDLKPFDKTLYKTFDGTFGVPVKVVGNGLLVVGNLGKTIGYLVAAPFTSKDLGDVKDAAVDTAKSLGAILKNAKEPVGVFKGIAFESAKLVSPVKLLDRQLEIVDLSTPGKNVFTEENAYEQLHNPKLLYNPSGAWNDHKSFLKNKGFSGFERNESRALSLIFDAFAAYKIFDASHNSRSSSTPSSPTPAPAPFVPAGDGIDGDLIIIQGIH